KLTFMKTTAPSVISCRNRRTAITTRDLSSWYGRAMIELNEGREQTEQAGESTTPQARAEGLARGDKSSAATEVNTSASVGRSQFAARIARTELDTGAVLLVLENHATPTLALRGSLRAGSYFEPRDKPGLARLTAEMLARGTRQRTKLQLAGDLEAVGAELDFQTDPFAVSIAGRALAKDMPPLL